MDERYFVYDGTIYDSNYLCEGDDCEHTDYRVIGGVGKYLNRQKYIGIYYGKMQNHTKDFDSPDEAYHWVIATYEEVIA